jgi:tetratricopeptide (TPR) repeat protein
MARGSSLTANDQGSNDMFEGNTNNEPPAFIKAANKLKNAVAYESTGKYESALELLEEALALQENYVDAWLIKGVIFGKMGMCSEALKCYDKIIEIDPKFADAWRLKAATFTLMNQHGKAVECFAKAVELDPDNLEYRLSLAVAFQRLKRFEDALKCYEEAKKQRPTDARIDYYIGLMWGNLADYKKALVSFEQALRLKPDFRDALLGKGIMLARLNRKDEAKECADKLLETKGTSEKQQSAKAQSENEEIRNDFKDAQKKFSNKFSSPTN